MKYIHTRKAPDPAGHYSQAIVSGSSVFVSGQLPIDPDSGEIKPSIEDQTSQVLNNLEAILIASGSSLHLVVKCTVYISDISLWGKVNEIYAARFGNHKPARAMVPTRELHFGCLIEIDAVAEVD